MVFILAALKEFNDEDSVTFLNRAWNIINGTAFQDTEKTLVHLCRSHFLNSVKRYLKKKMFL
jgi:hypothetical protein